MIHLFGDDEQHQHQKPDLDQEASNKNRQAKPVDFAKLEKRLPSPCPNLDASFRYLNRWDGP